MVILPRAPLHRIHPAHNLRPDTAASILLVAILYAQIVALTAFSIVPNAAPPSLSSVLIESRIRYRAHSRRIVRICATTPPNGENVDNVAEGCEGDIFPPAPSDEIVTGASGESVVSLWEAIVSFKEEEVYARIRRAWDGLVSLVSRSVKASGAWVRDDGAGQLAFLFFANFAFLAAVAAFAAWNVELLGGRKWSGPDTGIVVPKVIVPAGSSSVKFQKPVWKFPERASRVSADGRED
mmetsp:Transcript_32280/g.63924  ORF Transcript_32280/g.63924 Transcript_32280/m.63924 type:complete len:238 (+) Transcript_32280:93-806(+)